jgi:hypothetical protein
MELMRCPTLAQTLQEKRRLEEQKVVLYVRQAAQALDTARDVGLFHGDLAPNNVFVVSDERIRLGDFALKGFIEEPELLAQFAQEAKPKQAAADADDWVTAEDLLGAKGEAAGGDKLEADFVGLAGLMMTMLGIEVPARQPLEALDDYRGHLMDSAYARMADPTSGISAHVCEVAKRLLTPGGFESPGEVVVELASAMLLRRTTVRAGSPTATGTVPAGAEAGRAAQEPAAAAAPSASGNMESLQFRGDPRTGPFTPFFLWGDRHGGRFFVIYDGERLALGRDPDVADIVLMDPAISRRHCLLSKSGGVIKLEDLGSTNGVFINEKRVRAAEIQAGDCLRLGATKLYMTFAGRES